MTEWLHRRRASRTTAAERQQRGDTARAALHQEFGIHTTDEEVEQADEFVRNLPRHARVM